MKEVVMESLIEAVTTDYDGLEQLNPVRSDAVHSIDPETAEVIFCYRCTLEADDDSSDMAEEQRQAECEYFARSPGERTWVWSRDLPETTRDALCKRLMGARHGANGGDPLHQTRAADGIATEPRVVPIERLYDLADECAYVIAEMATEFDVYFADDGSSLIQDGFARMVKARVGAIRREKVKVNERWPTETEEEYIYRVARDEAGGSLEEQRQLIATALGKHGDLTEEQLRLLSARTLVVMEKVQEGLNDEQHQPRGKINNKRSGESDDDFVQRVARDDAGLVLLKKRQILAEALRELGSLTQEEVTQISAETVVIVEEAYDYGEYVGDFIRHDMFKRWGPLVLYWERLKQSESGEMEPLPF